MKNILERLRSVLEYKIEQANHKLVDMKILNEMSTVCKKSEQAGFIAQIYSRDHSHPHMHIFDMSNKELGEIYITEKQPKSKKDIITYKGKIPEDIKENILVWSKKKNKYKTNNWDSAKSLWEMNHSDDEEIKFYE